MKQSQETLSDDSSGEEMTLADMWHLLRAGWRFILAGFLVSMSVATAYLAVVPKQYEASVLVRLGQVGRAGSLCQPGALSFGSDQANYQLDSGSVQLIESAQDASQRMQGAEFRNAVVDLLGWKRDERARSTLGSLQVTIPDEKHLKVRVVTETPNDAKNATEAALSILVGIHQKLSDRIVAGRVVVLESIQAEIADSEAFLLGIEPVGKDVAYRERERFLNGLKVVKDEKSRLRNLRLQENALKASVSPELLESTRAASEVEVPAEAIRPRPRMVYFFAAVAGGLLGALFLVLSSINQVSASRKSRALEER